MFRDYRANNKMIHLHYEHPIIANLEVIAFEGEKAPWIAMRPNPRPMLRRKLDLRLNLEIKALLSLPIPIKHSLHLTVRVNLLFL